MKKILVLVLAVTLMAILLFSSSPVVAYGPDYHVYKSLPMYYSCVSSCWCGPSSGTSIGQYYRNRSASTYGSNYPNLPDDDDMYAALYEYMDTAYTGYTDPPNYGPGFVEMALHYGYDNFSYIYYSPESDAGPVNADSFWVIKEAINNGWPVAVASVRALQGFEGVDAISTDEQHPTNHWPCTVWHWIAIKGYDYWANPFGYTWDHHITCTDSWSWADNLVLDWDQLVDVVGEDYLRMVIIKDVDPDGDGPYVEDFEWGIDGASLDTSGGEVDWTVETDGSSVAEIDTEVTHEESQGSARFYKYDSSSSSAVRAYYSLQQPSYIGFYLKKGDTAYASTKNGNGAKIIDFRIDSEEHLQYYDSSWHTLSGTLSLNWNHIEVKNINWGAGTYDIYINGSWKVTATMRSGSIYGGNLWFGSWTGGPSEFWIDDIIDLIPEPEATTVELLPETDSNPVDTFHTLTATVYGQFGIKMDSVSVTWSIISGVGSFFGTPEGVTDAGGEADAVITSSVPGTSTVTCEVTGNPSVFDTATKDWTYTPAATTIELMPEADSNPVGETHELTATVYDQFGYLMEGLEVIWTIEDGPGAFVYQDTTTDANGQADAEIISTVPGISTVICEVPGITQVAGGIDHTVGLKYDGTVVAVGYNNYGQCDVGGWTDITQVAAGCSYTVGLKSDGTVVAVGYNTHGQCDVGGWTDITQVAACYWHTVGLKSDGTVVAVGDNGYGQCDVDGWTDITQVAAGSYYTVGLKSDGTMVAVGDNRYGQCDVGGWTDITQVTAGSWHTVGLKSDCTVVAVGSNNYGQCDVGGWTDITQVAAGWSYTVGLKSDDTVLAVGYNYYGQCDVGGWTDITQIGAGWYHTVGLKSDGTVLAVGENDDGQCDVDDWRGPIYDIATKDWTYTPEATTLELSPETGENPVGTTHNLTAMVYDQFSYVMEGVDVTWIIDGVGSFSGTPESPTDANGQADAVITSSVPGASMVTCEVTDNLLVYDIATNNWTYTPEATTLEIVPETSENPVDTTHNLTATVYDQFSYVMEGVDVTWIIDGVGSFSGTPESPTDANGQADAVITSSVPGTSTVKCEVTGNPSVYDTATKDWTYTPEATTLELLPETGENPVDTTHNLTSTVYDQFGYEMEGVDVTWNISGMGSFSGTPEGVTDADGEADAVITSSVLGASTVRCEVTGNPSVYDTATKDWTYLEDFEWGNDGDSLGMDGGNIDWTVETDGSSVAEIDTAQANSGTRSGRFYYDGSSENILAYYSQDSPTWRGFYLRKDKNAIPYTITGDGTNTVFIRVTRNEWVQYYDGSWQSVCKISDSTWHFIEFRNIDWVAATYDIYVDNNLEKSDTPMSASTSYNGLTAYYGGDYESEFWIDDILK